MHVLSVRCLPFLGDMYGKTESYVLVTTQFTENVRQYMRNKHIIPLQLGIDFSIQLYGNTGISKCAAPLVYVIHVL
jgi:hypothetical protein